MAESVEQVVSKLEKIKNDLEDYKKNNDKSLSDFKAQTTGRFKEVTKRIDKQDTKITETKKQVVDLEKLVIIMVEQQKFANEKLTKIDGTSTFIRNALITGAVSILVAVIIRFA